MTILAIVKRAGEPDFPVWLAEAPRVNSWMNFRFVGHDDTPCAAKEKVEAVMWWCVVEVRHLVEVDGAAGSHALELFVAQKGHAPR